jgi:hypothetical protein
VSTELLCLRKIRKEKAKINFNKGVNLKDVQPGGEVGLGKVLSKNCQQREI